MNVKKLSSNQAYTLTYILYHLEAKMANFFAFYQFVNILMLNSHLMSEQLKIPSKKESRNFKWLPKRFFLIEPALNFH